MLAKGRGVSHNERVLRRPLAAARQHTCSCGTARSNSEHRRRRRHWWPCWKPLWWWWWANQRAERALACSHDKGKESKGLTIVALFAFLLFARTGVHFPSAARLSRGVAQRGVEPTPACHPSSAFACRVTHLPGANHDDRCPLAGNDDEENSPTDVSQCTIEDDFAALTLCTAPIS